MDNYKLIIIIFVIYLIIFINIGNLYEYNDNYKYNRNIITDGYTVIDNDNKNEILKLLPNNYHYIDYKYEIKGCTLSTFHRDVTSSQYIFKTKFPVYTHISYYNQGPLLSICPKSHLTAPYLASSPLIIYGKPKTSILFNCDCIHAGALNNLGNQRHAIQYKICHIDDLPKLKHLIGINKLTSGLCDKIDPNYNYFLRKFSLYFSYIINHLMTDLLQKKPEKDSILEYVINNYYIGDFYNT